MAAVPASIQAARHPSEQFWYNRSDDFDEDDPYGPPPPNARGGGNGAAAAGGAAAATTTTYLFRPPTRGRLDALRSLGRHFSLARRQQQQQQQQHGQPGDPHHPVHEHQPHQPHRGHFAHKPLAESTQHHATPLLAIILWTSMASIYPVGYSTALARDWIYSLPGVSEALRHRSCGPNTCPPPDASWHSPLSRAFLLAPQAGLLVGAAIGAYLLRMRGRRAALMSSHAAFIVAFTIAAAAQNYGALLAGIVGAEAAVGAVYVAVVIVDAELAPPNRRLAFITAAGTLAYGLGWASAASLILAQTSLSHSARLWFWRSLVALGAWPCMLLLVIVPFVPESPLLLVQQGRTAEAMQTLKDLRGPFVDVSAEFSGIITACIEAETADARARRDGRAGWRSLLPPQLRLLLAPRHRPSVWVAALVGAFCGVQGIAAGLALRLEVIDRAALGGFYKWSLARFLSYLGVPLGLVAILLGVDRFSRRKLIVGSTAVMLVALLGLAAVDAVPYGAPGQPPYPRSFVVGTFLLAAAVSICFESVANPACLLLPAELTAAGARPAVMAAFYAVYRFTRVVWGTVTTTQALTDHYTAAVLLTGALLALLALLVWLFVPEGTQGRRLEECRQAWQQHWYWGQRKGLWAMDLPQRRSGRASLRHSLSTALASAHVNLGPHASPSLR